MTTEQAHKALSALGLRPYTFLGNEAHDDAQRNLSGRSHYASDENLKFFRAKVVHCRADEGGLLLSIIESSPDPGTGKPGKRAVIFDALGTVIYRGPHYKIIGRAVVDRNAEILTYNTLYELETALINRATSLRETANEVMTAISGEVAP
ncbi:hypothetical protein UFOVP296_11 [uncultured Caudovirales phage]|uniref:Uncharacterized protein n=1 Tax=uncultured Caudovirales phage TaxID=2100421 RepID=A0A6J5PF15_9CAUD|nr:hypothetical protein UFOVP296_11 [uncultured Caudovirales phage]CAB4170033.1 hypothetical protein UFOVP912_30 [uncultured Caudovirales phage]CAB4199152.1 hypothetical protein UFOVP1334_18 [uncultured Caudovirales phage]